MSPKWDQEISSGSLSDALTRLALEVQPDITDQPLRQKALKRRLQKRGYSKAEILYAVDRLADDPDLDEKIRYGGDLSAADFRRVIEPIQKTRRLLRQGKLLTEEEVWDAIGTVPDLEREDFGTARREDVDRRFVLEKQARKRLGVSNG